MTRMGGLSTNRSKAIVGAAALSLLALAACAEPPPPHEPPLVADPPLSDGPTAADGVVATEIQRGEAFLKSEKWAEAKEHFKKAFEAKPNAHAATYVGQCDEKLGDRKSAEDWYRKALALDAGFVDAAVALSAIFLEDPAKPDEAIAVLKKSLEKAKDSGPLFQNLGYAYGVKGDMENAGKSYEAALAKGDDPQIRFAYGSLLFDNKMFAKAAVQLKKALDGVKDDPAMLSTLGVLLAGSHAYGDCVSAYDRAIKIKGTNPEWYVRRGRCRHELNDKAGAQADYNQAIKVDEKFAAAHYYLALSLLDEKKRQLATLALEKAVKHGGASPIGKLAKEKLETLKKK